MVRLKLDSLKISALIYIGPSQFHYGSIKTGHDINALEKAKVESQFHYGSIKTLAVLKNGKKYGRVSIPLWFD